MAARSSSKAEGSRIDNDKFKQIIRKAYAKLRTSLTKPEVFAITANLYASYIILGDERERIQASSTDTDSAQALCNIILKKNEFACEIFLKALREISRDSLANLHWEEASKPDQPRSFGSHKWSSTPNTLVCATDSSPSVDLSRTKEVSPVTSTEPPSEAGDASAEGADLTERIPAVEVSNILRTLSTGLKKIEEEVGSFANTLGKNMKLTAHIHNPETTSEISLEPKLKESLRRHIPEPFDILVINQAPDTDNFCGDGIRVADARQTLGLFLQYGDEDTVYWASCAQGLMGARINHGTQPQQCPQMQVLDKQFSETMHRETTPQVRAVLCTGRRQEVSINLRSPYVYLNYDPSIRANGTILLHSVDFMVGVTPLTSSHLTNSGSLSSRFVSPEDAQCHVQECLNTRHSENCILSRTLEIHYFELENLGDALQWFNAEELEETRAHVVCRVSGNSRLLSGNVTSVMNTFAIYITNVDQPCMVQNAIVIEPSPDSIPELGHSGGVWFMKKRTGRGYSAIAMTFGILGWKDGKRYWLASLLCASLLAVSEEYPRMFPDYRRFRVFDLRQQAGADF